MKIIKLVAENIKGLKAIEIIPDENLQIISGKNGQGKTSVMDSIWLALAGGHATKSMSKPIREGEESAYAELDLGEFVVTRKWTSNEKSTLQVVSKQGSKFSSPQKLLDELIGKLSFDPLAFSNLETKEQLKTLLKIVEIDPTGLDNEKKTVFEERTMVNREVKNLAAQLEVFDLIDENLPEEEIHPTTILTEISEAQKQLNENMQKRSELSGFRVEYNQSKSDLVRETEELQKKMIELDLMKTNLEDREKKIQSMKETGISLAAQVETLVDPDLSVFNQKLSEVDDTNKKIREKKRFQELESQHFSSSLNATNLTNKLKEIEERKSEIMKSAKFPIPELTFDESGVLYNGVPFKQCSSAERLKVSTAMAMALNPKLRVIRILDGSLLDSGNLQMIQDMAKEKDFQVWVEQVDESGKVGIVIEDGEVKKIEVA